MEPQRRLIRVVTKEQMKEVENFIDSLGQGTDEKEFLRAVVQGLADMEAGRSVSIAEAKKRLGLA